MNRLEGTRMEERYLETFANEYGEKWWYDYDARINEGIIWGTDVDYHKYRVIDGECNTVVLNRDEKDWVKACWDKHKKGV